MTKTLCVGGVVVEQKRHKIVTFLFHKMHISLFETSCNTSLYLREDLTHISLFGKSLNSYYISPI